MTCSADGCEGKVTARGLCGRHYKAWQVAGKPEGPALLERRERRCAELACETAVYARDHCERHYRQLLRAGEIQEGAPPTMCAVFQCDRQSEARGWCHGHYLRW